MKFNMNYGLKKKERKFIYPNTKCHLRNQAAENF